MLKLNNLTRLNKKRKRVGRGGSRGGTSGKGHKGQKARSGGKARPGFEGGQMPLYRRLPKRGFNNARFARTVVIANIDRIDTAFEEGARVDRQALLEKGVVSIKSSIHPASVVLKILGKGDVSKKFMIVADAFSATAKQAIENAGGQALLTKES